MEDNFLQEKDKGHKPQDKQPERVDTGSAATAGENAAGPAAGPKPEPKSDAQPAPDHAGDGEPKGLDALFSGPPADAGNLSEGADANWIQHTGNPERTRQNLIENHEVLLAYYRAAGNDQQVAQQEKLLAILQGKPGPAEAEEAEAAEGVQDVEDNTDQVAEAAGQPDMKLPDGSNQPKLAEGWGEPKDDWGKSSVKLGGPDEEDWGKG